MDSVDSRVVNWNLSVPYKLAQGPMSSIGQTVVKGTTQELDEPSPQSSQGSLILVSSEWVAVEGSYVNQTGLGKRVIDRIPKSWPSEATRDPVTRAALDTALAAFQTQHGSRVKSSFKAHEAIFNSEVTVQTEVPAYASYFLYQLVNHWQLKDLKMCLEGGSFGEKLLGPAPQMEIDEHTGIAHWASRPLP